MTDSVSEETYSEEREKLTLVISHIRSELDLADRRMQTHAADRSARVALRDA